MLNKSVGVVCWRSLEQNDDGPSRRSIEALLKPPLQS